MLSGWTAANPMTDAPAPLCLSLESLEATAQVGELIGCQLPELSVGLFTGELAAGKTTFIKAICAGIGIDSRIVISPTYTMTNIYQGRFSVFHVDLYRLNAPDEIETMDVDDWVNPRGITLIEWPQMAGHILADLPTLTFHLTLQGDAVAEGRRLAVVAESMMYAPIVQTLAGFEGATPLTPACRAGLWRPCRGDVSA